MGASRVRFFAVESTEPGTAGLFLGFVGVAYPSFLPALAHRPELGWRLGRQAWGRGLATEAAVAVLDMAFGCLAFSEVIAVIHPENARSQRVAHKVGMHVEQQVHNPVLGRLVDIWQVTTRTARVARSTIVLRVGHDRKEGDPGVLRRLNSSAAKSTVSPRGGA
ncbi:MAG: GNAT family N-acetyltransferase [Acidimicrobiales bacterium]